MLVSWKSENLRKFMNALGVLPGKAVSDLKVDNAFPLTSRSKKRTHPGDYRSNFGRVLNAHKITHRWETLESKLLAAKIHLFSQKV